MSDCKQFFELLTNCDQILTFWGHPLSEPIFKLLFMSRIEINTNIKFKLSSVLYLFFVSFLFCRPEMSNALKLDFIYFFHLKFLSQHVLNTDVTQSLFVVTYFSFNLKFLVKKLQSIWKLQNLHKKSRQNYSIN